MFWTQRCRECFSFDKISHHSDNTQSPHLGNASLLLDNQFPPGVDVTKSVGGVAEVVSIINVFNILKRINIGQLSSVRFTSSHLDSQTAIAGDVEPVPCELVSAVIPLDDGFGRPECLAAEPDLAAGHCPHHRLGGRGDLRGQRQHVDEHVLVHVAVHSLAGGVAPVVASVLLGEVHDGDAVRGHCPPRVGRSLLNRLPVVDPLDLGRGVSLGLALEGHCLALGRGLTLWLLGEVGLGVHLELDGVALRDPHTVAGLARVVALIVEVHVFDHQGLAVVVVGCSALRQRTAFLCPSVNKQSLDTAPAGN